MKRRLKIESSASGAGTETVRSSGLRRLGSRQRGIALVITLILLSVITFLAITFLAVARREKGSVTTSTEQKVATFASESGAQHAIGVINATILASTNVFNLDLLVSTNFVNSRGFDPVLQPLGSPPNITNINFDYKVNGQPLNIDEARQNLGNLLFSPRPPVFITNRQAANSVDFRYYLDLNRDGVFTPGGYLVVTNPGGGFYSTVDGSPIPPFAINPYDPIPAGVVSNWFIGDPVFIGILERPEFPHSPSNKFVARYAFIVVPAGKTLDVNYIHNHAKLVPGLQLEGFFRNMGVGSWENNFAAFLRDLNTNAWQTYSYRTNLDGSGPSTGVAFDDAHSFVQYRLRALNPIAPALASVDGMFGVVGANAFRRDFYDGYTAGPLLTDFRGWNYLGPVDADIGRTAQRWPGAYNPDHFFTTQDFFDRAKAGYNATALPAFSFVERIFAAQTNSLSSYDRNTFYRMLAQLGTDSAPDPDEKLNLNYINVGGWKSTNFVSWNDSRVQSGDASLGIAPMNRRGSEIFFTNAVDRLLKRYTAEWQARSSNQFYQMFGTNRAFGAGEIPVMVNGRFAYTPSIHRVLQLAANMWDAMNPSDNATLGPEPTVFRPRFKTVGTNIYIEDFIEWPVFNPAEISPQPIDLSFSNALAAIQQNPTNLVFGVPFVIGARKGLPNFNEFASESVVQVTRKLDLVKSGPGGGNLIIRTNQYFTIGISNAFGAEFWNSYSSNYSRPVDIAVINYPLYALTNDFGFIHRSNLTASGQIFKTGTGTDIWPRWDSKNKKDASLLVPLRSNHVVIPDLVCAQDSTRFIGRSAPDNTVSSVPLPFPRWGLTITNRVVAYVRDRNTGRLLDYVQLSGMVVHRELAGEMAQEKNAQGFAGLWATNTAPDGVHLSDLYGVINQIQISKGDIPSGSGEWQQHGLNQPSGTTKDQEIAKFAAFFTPDNRATYNGLPGHNTNTTASAPFTPTWKQSMPMLWQANDPFVHYTTGDMEFLERSRVGVQWNPPSRTNFSTLNNLGQVNERYRPWGGNPFQSGYGSDVSADANAYNYVFKDPGVKSPDKWEFLTNKLATLGWLGRVHRGSPWQTVYLKSAPSTNAVEWRNWSGNRNVWNTNNVDLVYDAEFTVPEADRVIFDVFTTALNENASRGQLPINQTNLAAWSAVFGGMLALTNSSSPVDFENLIARYEPVMSTNAPGNPAIDPAGVYDPLNTNTYPQLVKIVAGINRERARTRTVRINNVDTQVFVHDRGTFNRLGDILSVPELTTASPFLNHGFLDEFGHNQALEIGLNDAVMEWLPQQMMSLVKLGEPRFVVYAYGQGLKPADQSVVVSGPYFGMVTNYQITAEVVTRAVVRLEGSPDPTQTDTNLPPRMRYPMRAVVESYNVLGPE